MQEDIVSQVIQQNSDNEALHEMSNQFNDERKKTESAAFGDMMLSIICA